MLSRPLTPFLAHPTLPAAMPSSPPPLRRSQFLPTRSVVVVFAPPISFLLLTAPSPPPPFPFPGQPVATPPKPSGMKPSLSPKPSPSLPRKPSTSLKPTVATPAGPSAQETEKIERLTREHQTVESEIEQLEQEHRKLEAEFKKLDSKLQDAQADEVCFPLQVECGLRGKSARRRLGEGCALEDTTKCPESPHHTTQPHNPTPNDRKCSRHSSRSPTTASRKLATCPPAASRPPLHANA